MKATCQNLFRPTAFKVIMQIKFFTYIYIYEFSYAAYFTNSFSRFIQKQKEQGGEGEEEEEECIRHPLFRGKSARLRENYVLAAIPRTQTSNLTSRQR